jgi:hypothetical protein
MGIAFTGIALIGAIAGLIMSGRMSALLNFFLCIVSPRIQLVLGYYPNRIDSWHSSL